MKLYLSSYRIPTPGALAELIGKPLRATSVALIAKFAAVVPVFRSVHQGKDIIELNDSQAVIFNGQEHFVVEEESSVDEAYS